MSEDVHVGLRPGLALIWRSLTEVQVGSDPRWSVVLDDLSPTASRALRDLAPTGDRRDLRTALEQADVPREEVDDVVAHLAASQLLLTGPPRPVDNPDEAAWSLLEPDGDGEAVVAARARRRVHVRGLDRLGTAVALQLAAAGIGTVVPEDPGVVTGDDAVPGGLRPDDVGAPRADAVAALLGREAPTTRTAPHRGAPDLVVHVEHGAVDPLRHREAASTDQPHLSVVVREASVLVGPLVVPGRTPCLRCADLHRADHDPRWAAVAAQLVGRASRTGLETTLAATAAAVTAGQVVAHLDGRATSVVGGALEVRLPELLPRHMTWPLHPRCGCSGLDVS